MNGYVVAGYLSTAGVLVLYALRTVTRERKLRSYFTGASAARPVAPSTGGER